MNKFAAVPLSALMLLNVCPVMAEQKTKDGILVQTQEDQPVVIETADDFIEAFAGCRIAIEKDKKKSEEFIWFEKADAHNYPLILQGYDLLPTLKTELQKEIAQKYEEQKIDYDALVKAAQSLKKEADEAAAAQAEKDAANKQQESAQNAQSSAGTSNSENAGQSSSARPAEPVSDAGAGGQPGQSVPDNAGANTGTSANTNANNNADNLNNNNSNANSNNNQNGNNNSADGSNAGQTQPESPAGQKTPDASTEPGNTDQPKNPQDQNDPTKSPDDSSKEEADPSTNPSEAGSAVLYEQTIPTSSLGDIVLRAQGTPVEDWRQSMPRLYRALEASSLLTGEQLDAAKVYTGVVFSSQKDDLAASGAPLTAVSNAGQTTFFQFIENEGSDDVLLSIMNPSDFSISFTQGTVTLNVKDTLTLTLPPDEPSNTEEPKPAEDGELTTPEEAGQISGVLPSGTAGTILQTPSLAPLIEMEQTPQTPAQNEAQISPAKEEGSTAPEESATANEEKPAAIAAAMPAAEVLGEKVQESARQAENRKAARTVLAADQAKTNPESQSKIQTESASRLYSNAVNSFIASYCSNSQGLIYLKAWSANYQQIMSGFSVWKALSAADKQAINARLAEVGSVSYTALYRQAARVSLGLGAGTSSSQTNRPPVLKTPATGTLQHGFTYSFLSVLSGFLSCLFLSKSFRKREE